MVPHAGNLALLGGELCLNFANTVEYRASDRTHEFLKDYSDLVLWSWHVDILTDEQAEHLLQEVRQRQEEADDVFEQAIALRETIYKVFTAIIGGYPPDSASLETLNALLAKALARLRIVSTGRDFIWDWASNDKTLDQVLWPIVRSAAELLTSDELSRVKQCAGCGWLFVDRSRNRSRRWCDMRVCGNRAKARRYYERQRKQSSRSSNPSPGAA